MRKTISRFVSGLRWRLLLLVLVACAPLVGWMLHSAGEDRRRLIEDWKQRSQEMMQLACREEEKIVAQTRQLLLAMAESSPVQSGNRRDCKKYLEDLFASDPRYANLGVIKTNGDFLTSARTPARPANEADHQLFHRVLKTRAFTIGDFSVEHPIGKPTISFASPVLDPAGQIQAVVFAALDLDWFNRFESELLAQLPKEATWTKIDRKGTILVRYPAPEKWIGRPFPEPALLKTVLNQNSGLVEVAAPEGGTGFYAFASMHSQLVPGKAVTLLGIPKPALLAGVDHKLMDNLTGLGIAAGFTFLVGWIGSSLLILRPVRTLVRSSARLATDRFSTRTGLAHRGDELGQLTRTFDHMAQTLEHREVSRQSAENAMEVSEMRYRRLFEAAQDGILILNADTGQIDDVNPFLTDLLGYSRAELLGNKLWEIRPFKDTKASQAEFRELQREACVRYEDLPLETRAGKSINVEFVSNVYQVNGSKVIQCNIRDITKRKQAEAKRKEYSRKLQVLSRRLVETQETERRHLAHELHDEIGQALTVMQLNLQAILQLPGTKALTARLTESLAVVDRVLEQVDDISLNLRPSILDDLGLEPALRWYIDRQAALVGLQADFHAEPLAQRLDPVIETACFRVAQGALTNVVRHARAQTVTVDLRAEAECLHLRVHDDGGGFEVAAVRARAVRGASLGLLSMEERAGLAGGELKFKSAPGQGTEVHAWFPLKWQTPPA